MVRGIYQTSDAEGRDWGVKFGVAIAFVLILVGVACWSIQKVGEGICCMPGFYDSKTYKEHVKNELVYKGYGFRSVRDLGDWPSERAYSDFSEVRFRTFIVTDLRVPGEVKIPKAEVTVRFKEGQTTIASYKSL